MVKILVIDSDPSMRRWLAEALAKLGLEAEGFDAAEPAAEWVARGGIDLVVAELPASEPDSKGFVDRLRGEHGTTKVILSSALAASRTP